jgi:hypothetical protein
LDFEWLGELASSSVKDDLHVTTTTAAEAALPPATHHVSMLFGYPTIQTSLSQDLFSPLERKEKPVVVLLPSCGGEQEYRRSKACSVFSCGLEQRKSSY